MREQKPIFIPAVALIPAGKFIGQGRK